MRNRSARSAGVLAFVVSLASAFGAHGQTYPSKPIRLIIPFAPGGITDIPWRIVAPRLSEALGQPIVLDNRPGAGSTIGAAAVARAAPDGYTLLGTSMSHVISGIFYKNLDYDAIDDFLYVAQIGATNQTLVIHPSLPVSSVKQLIALAKAKPGQLDYGSSGAGGANHLSFALFVSISGVDITHVPYKTVSLMTTDLIAGRVSSAFIGVALAAPYVANKRLRALAVSSKSRSQFLPDVPTMQESGVKGAESPQVSGLLAPRKITPEIARRLESELEKVTALPDVRKSIAASGTEVNFESSRAFSALMTSESAKWRRMMTALKISAE